MNSVVWPGPVEPSYLAAVASHELGWDVLAWPPSGPGTRVHRYRQRLRVVIAEPLRPRYAPRLPALQARARHLLAAGVPADYSADLLCERIKHGGSPASLTFAVTVIDLDRGVARVSRATMHRRCCGSGRIGWLALCHRRTPPSRRRAYSCGSVTG
jgi:hypothetical protein